LTHESWNPLGNGAPALLRPRFEQFIQFFDAHLVDELPSVMAWMKKAKF